MAQFLSDSVGYLGSTALTLLKLPKKQRGNALVNKLTITN